MQNEPCLLVLDCCSAMWGKHFLSQQRVDELNRHDTSHIGQNLIIREYELARRLSVNNNPRCRLWRQAKKVAFFLVRITLHAIKLHTCAVIAAKAAQEARRWSYCSYRNTSQPFRYRMDKNNEVITQVGKDKLSCTDMNRAHQQLPRQMTSNQIYDEIQQRFQYVCEHPDWPHEILFDIQ